MTTKTDKVEACGAGSHFQTAVEAGRQAFQADAWQDGRCACFAFGWSEGARREEAAEVASTVDQTDGYQPKGESDYICGWCQQVVPWSDRRMEASTPYHQACWEHRQTNRNIAQAMNGERCSAPNCC